ncbi:hypothetical protein STEG23_015727 [Scotinomys teguina]
MWYIYTMEYYAAEKNNDIMKFAGKWMELENVILNKVVGSKKPAHEPEIDSDPIARGPPKQVQLQSCPVTGFGSPHLLPSVIGEKFHDESQSIHQSDLWGKPVQFSLPDVEDNPYYRRYHAN